MSVATAAQGRSSPEWVRISGASAIALRFASGRFSREFDFGGINLLLSYDDGCRSDCSYCGLARTRPGEYEDKSFIRVEWPLVRTDELVERMAEYESKLTRLCISMVTSPFSFRDTCDITSRIRSAVKAPLSILVAPPTLNRARLQRFSDLGVDMIGIGLDAVTEKLFASQRTDVPAGGAGLKWSKYWEVVDASRDIFGPWKVNCHTLVGLGETDADLARMFTRLLQRQVLPYLFCFNPEQGTRLARHPKSSVKRWRRVQLMKDLIETAGLGMEQLGFDEQGALVRIMAPRSVVEQAISRGTAFMTDGCPGEGGEPGCTRPFGSYRPSEPFRDYPFQPEASDLDDIAAQLQLEEILEEAR